IWGSEDTATPLSDAKVMNSLIDDSGLVVFEGVGHYSFLEQPARFNIVVGNFLGIDKFVR
ncbi:MAG: alpha/beta hydrolase, partial [Rikenellaceae bacterium]|nr:alpha/beta hydrolase [Rikenellaceae bacterium]